MRNKMNRKIILFAIAGITIEALSVLCFICVAKTEFAILGKQIFATIFLVSMSAFLVISVRSFPIKSLITLGVVFAIGSGIVIQGFGFFFPGLIKDVYLISFENLWRIGTVIVLHFCCYITGIFVIIALRNIISNNRTINIGGK